MNKELAKWLISQKCFGFIWPVNGGNDVLVPVSAVEGAGMTTLDEGQASISISLQTVAPERRPPTICAPPKHCTMGDML